MTAGCKKLMTKKLLYILAETEDFWVSRLPLAAAARDRGYEVHLAAPGAAGDKQLKKSGFTGHDLPPAQSGLSFSAALRNILTIRSMLRALKPDIVHTITLKYSLLTGLAAGRSSETKLVYTIAGLGYLFSAEDMKARIMLGALLPFLKYVLRNPSAAVIFQNPDDMNTLVRKNFVREEKAFLVRGSGVDLQKFAPGGGEDSGPPVVLMPTRLVRDKGISVFIDMAKILEKRQIPARFQVAGGITDHNPLAITEEEMERMVADSPVEWLGKVSDMPALYQKAALIVYPSWYGEGIPRVLLEAAACGKAIVTTDHPGCREAVAHNDNGLLIPVKNAEAAADAVEFLLKNPDHRKKMSAAGRIRAEREFGISGVVEKILKLYGL